MSAQSVIDVARAYLGVTEDPPGSNRTIFGAEYGLDGQPWCVMFLWYCFQHAGERMAFFGGGKTARCSVLLEWYQKQGLIVPVEQVQPGDIVLLNFNGKSTADHCGLVVETYGDAVFVIEGNTSPGLEGSQGSQNNGGCVALKQRNPSQIVAVCRPQYQPEPVTVDDVTGHWAYKDIQWAKDKGLLRGYADGSMRPDQPVTRAELAVILRRYAKE